MRHTRRKRRREWRGALRPPETGCKWRKRTEIRRERGRGSSSALVSHKNRNITQQTAIYWWVYCKQRLQQCLPLSLPLYPHPSWWSCDDVYVVAVSTELILCIPSKDWRGNEGGQFVNLVLWQRARSTLNKTDRLLKQRERKRDRARNRERKRRSELKNANLKNYEFRSHFGHTLKTLATWFSFGFDPPLLRLLLLLHSLSI